MSYRLSKAAENDVIDIFVDGEMLFGVAQAEFYHNGLETTLNMLAEYPESGKEYRVIDPPVRIFSYSAHLIIYTINNNDVLVLRVLNGRQDWVKHLA